MHADQHFRLRHIDREGRRCGPSQSHPGQGGGQGRQPEAAWGQYVSLSLDETTTRDDIALLWSVFALDGQALPAFDAFEKASSP
jgi:hypothetical protein